MSLLSTKQRPIRSFVRRQGRFTPGQQRAWQYHWPLIGIDDQALLTSMTEYFGRDAPLVVEIGFGRGDSLVAMADNYPHYNFLGIEVHLPGIGACLAASQQTGISNLRLIQQDAQVVFEERLPDASIDRLQLFFPDPWPKKRHHKRRLVQTPFLDLAHRKLKLGGLLHLATDWLPYAQQMLDLLQQHPGYLNVADQGGYLPRPEWRALTKFEQRGQRLGHGVWDLLFQRC
ncbi:MAG: tRNA (guanosine(46)-N7)-methyltransferase TrmB [Candidatus Symbiodolus clandestinus]